VAEERSRKDIASVLNISIKTVGFHKATPGYDLADFLLGSPYSTSRRYVDPAINPYGSSTYLRNRTFSL
jgi:hypothetical protein